MNFTVNLPWLEKLQLTAIKIRIVINLTFTRGDQSELVEIDFLYSGMNTTLKFVDFRNFECTLLNLINARFQECTVQSQFNFSRDPSVFRMAML